MPRTSSKSKVPSAKSENPIAILTGYFQNFQPNRKFYLGILIIGLLLLAVYKKSWIVAATVNGRPIFNLELQQRLNEAYRSQTLNQMVNEKLILDEAQKKGVVVTEEELNNKISELEKNLGGAGVFNSLLSQQGQTRDSVKKQLRLQLLIEKLYIGEATVSAQEVNDYLAQNKDTLKASDSAGQTKEAEDSLKQQKLTQIFGQKFQALKQQANIKIF